MALQIREIVSRAVAWCRSQIAGEEMRALIRRASAVLFAQAASAAALFLTGILLGRWLGAEAYGRYSFAVTVIIILRICASLGLPMLMMRTAAVYREQQDWPHLRGLLRFAASTVLISGSLAAAGAAIAIVLFAGNPMPAAAQLILTALPLLIVLPLTESAAGAMRGMHQVSLSQITEFSRSALNLVLLLVAVILFNLRLTAEHAIWLRFAAETIGMIITICLLLRFLPKEVYSAQAASASKLWRKSQLSFVAIDAMYLIYQQTDVLILGILRPMGEVGVYRMAANLSFVLVFASVIASAALGPLAASAWAAGRKEQLQSASVRLSRVAFALTLGIFVVLMAATPFIVRILGAEFAGLVLPLAILGGGQVIRGLMSAAPTIVLMTGAENEAARGVAISAVANVVLNFLLIWLFGMIGAAFATAISTLLLSVYYALVAHKHTGISGTVLPVHLANRLVPQR